MSDQVTEACRPAPATEAVGSLVQQGVRPLRCSRPLCDGAMVQGFAMQQTYTGTPDFAGSRDVVTMSPGGPGRMIGCWKCAACGWSVTAA